MGVSGENSSDRSKEQQNKRGGVDVLANMVVTAAVSHLEMSALNAEADWNAVGGCRCRVRVDTIQKKGHREYVKIKAMGVSGKKSSERTTRDNRTKEVEWTYFEACSSPPQCSTWKCPR